MDPALSSLFPIHKIGSDGFSWWIGQVESGPNDDPKKSGRYRVRIVGVHLKDCDATPSSKLPWANVMLPTTTPWSDGGVTGSSIGLDIGNWVVGFFLDNDKQKPLILGSIGHTAGATLLENVEKDPSPDENCKSFTTFIDPKTDPYQHLPLDSKEKNSESTTPSSSSTNGATGPGQAGKIANAVPGQASPLFYSAFGSANANNPHGQKVCVDIANPNCGSENNLKQNLTTVIGDMLKANQDSDGQLGDYYVSKFTGELNSYLSVGKEYINKAIKLVKSFIARLKGEIVKLMKDGVEKLVDAILYTEVAATDSLGNTNTGPINPDLGIKPFSPVTKKEARLKEIMEKINDILSEIGCSMEDLTQRIADYITDLLLGFLMDAYRGAVCLVDQIVDGILNKIIDFIESTLAQILGPLSELLDVIANPANLVGSIVSKALELLGISCDGPGAKCEKVTKKCTDCGDGNNDDFDDWLNDILDALEDGPLDESSYVCEEAKQNYPTENTSIVFVGGIPAALGRDQRISNNTVPITKLITYTSSNITVVEGDIATFNIERSGDLTQPSSIKVLIKPKTATLNVDFQKNYVGSVIGFARGEKRKSISFTTFIDTEIEGDETFFIRLEEDVSPEGYAVSFPKSRDFLCTIQENNKIPNIPDGITGLYVPPSSTLSRTYNPPSVIPTLVPLVPEFNITAEKPFYYENETVKFKIVGSNVSPGDVFVWELDVDSEDIVGGTKSGTITLDSNLEAVVSFVLAENNDNFRIDPPGTIPQTDENGDFILDEDGNVLYNEEEIITEFDDLDETLTLTIQETGDSGRTLILGENKNEPAYFVNADKTSYNEGDTACFYITTSNVPNGTIGSWTLSGDITPETIKGGELQGGFIIQEGKATVCIDLIDNGIEDGTRLVTFAIDNTNANENFIIASDFEEPIVEEIPTYSVETDKLSYKEGEVITYSITTTNVPDGTVLQWILYGVGITVSDFIGGKTFGKVVIIDNKATVFVSIAEDIEQETQETLTFLLSGTNGFAQVIIEGEIGDIGDEDDDVIIPVPPCLDKPIAGSPVTDDFGAIISIPIENSGCPYLEPPRVIITGSGVGATAIPLLDEAGKVSEIRVTRGGSGYKKNTSVNQNLICVIDSFTLLSPGKGYKEEPDVLINGQRGIAKAIIDERGFVISVQILDRSIEFFGLPKVTIQGGGGFGARVIPSLACLNNLDDLVSSGYAKIGTGKYIDCP